MIRRLRQLDLLLDRLRELVEARDPEVTQRVLAKQAVVMQNRLEMVTQIVAYIHADVEEPVAHTPVRECDQPPAHTLAVPGTIDLTTYMGSKSA